MKLVRCACAFAVAISTFAVQAQNVQIERRLIMSSRSAGRGLFTEVTGGQSLAFVDCKMIDPRAKHVEYSMDCQKIGNGVLPVTPRELEMFDAQMSSMVNREMAIKKVESPSGHALWSFIVPEMSLMVGMVGVTYVAYEIDPFNHEGRQFTRLRNVLEFPVAGWRNSPAWEKISVIQAVPVAVTIGALLYSIYKFHKVSSEARLAGDTLEDILSYKNPDLATKVTGDEISSAYQLIEDIITNIFEYRSHT